MSVVVKGRSLCDLELLLVGAFSPLIGYLNRDDYLEVLENMKLKTGEVWPMPIVYRINESELNFWTSQKRVVLQDETNLPLAHFTIEDVYKPDLFKEVECVFGTSDTNHPYVKEILDNPDVYYVGGKVEMINKPFHFDFASLRLTPDEVKAEMKRRGWTKMVGFQTRNPMHKSHQQLTLRSLQQVKNKYPNEKCGLLLHPVVGITQACDVDYHARVACYKELIKTYAEDEVILSLLPLSMRMGGPREALWHSLIRKNYGCSHFIVGRDHAGPSYKTKEGKSFYGPYDAHQLVEEYSNQIGLDVIASKMIVYEANSQTYKSIEETNEDDDVKTISGTELRQRLKNRDEIPEWFTYPNISKILQKNTKSSGGFCLYLIGLSGSGKSVLAKYLHESLSETFATKAITILDGDLVRQELSRGLGFSKQDRSLNVRRIGYVASEIVKHGGIVICSNIAPYQEDRDFNRQRIEQHGSYYEVFVSTTLSKCEERDCKGLYEKARKGIIKQFTGISDPFEEPIHSEFKFESNTTDDLKENIETILERLKSDGFS